MDSWDFGLLKFCSQIIKNACPARCARWLLKLVAWPSSKPSRDSILRDTPGIGLSTQSSEDESKTARSVMSVLIGTEVGQGIGSGYWRVVAEVEDLIDLVRQFKQRTLSGVGFCASFEK